MEGGVREEDLRDRANRRGGTRSKQSGLLLHRRVKGG